MGHPLREEHLHGVVARTGIEPVLSNPKSPINRGFSQIRVPYATPIPTPHLWAFVGNGRVRVLQGFRRSLFARQWSAHGQPTNRPRMRLATSVTR